MDGKKRKKFCHAPVRRYKKGIRIEIESNSTRQEMQDNKREGLCSILGMETLIKKKKNAQKK